jgi:PAS domain S-box-containing protein
MSTHGIDPTQTRKPEQSAGVAKTDLHVLLVEDNADDAVLLERHLRRDRFDPRIVRVETSSEMYAALANMRPEEFHCIVLADYNLPQFSGPEALRILKASGIDLPFIMLSGAVSEEAAVESMRAGAQDYVTKQNLARLVPAIERELKEAAARRNRVAAEQALRASEARFHRLVEAMPLGLVIAEASGRIVYANGAVERMLGYSADTVSVGKFAAAGAVTLSSICPTLDETIAQAIRDGATAHEPFEAVCINATGESLDVLIGIALLNPQDRPDRFQVAAFIADMTMRKNSEKVLRQTEKLAVAGRLAASIAHDINNPLEAITNCLYLVGRGELSADTRTYLEMAQRELDLVSKITMQTLRFHRRSARPHSTDLQELVESVLDLLGRRIKEQEIEVTREFHEVPKIVVHEGEIRQVLANLIGNALDALPTRGRLVLRTSLAHDWIKGAVGVRVTVADNGSGMDAATMERIFEPFFSTKGLTGTGLGLWISKDLVEKHNGCLRVRSSKARDSRPGTTVFTMFLPLESIESAAW